MGMGKTQNEKHKHEFSKGEKIFDLGVYGVVGFGVNTALSIWVTHKLQKGNPEIFRNMGKKFASATHSMGMKNWGGAEKFGTMLSNYGCLLSGGFAVLPVVWGFEQYRKPIARAIDDKLGSTPPMVTLPDGEEVDALDIAPKTTAFSLLSARIFSIGVGYGPLLTLVNAFPEMHRPLQKILVTPAVKMGPKFIPKDAIFTDTVAKELISSSTTSASLYIVNRLVAWWDNQRKQGKGDVPQMAGIMIRQEPNITLPHTDEVKSAEKTAQNTPRHQLQEVAEYAPLQEQGKQLAPR